MNDIYLVTGSRGAGKTSFCASVAAGVRQSGWQTAGILSHAVFSGVLRSSIEAEDLRSSERRILAVRRQDASLDPRDLGWIFDLSVVEWGSRIFQTALPCDLLVVDELGPLELERGQGWQTALQAIATGGFRLALVVIRAELLPEALMRWPEARIIEIEMPDESQQKSQIFIKQILEN